MNSSALAGRRLPNDGRALFGIDLVGLRLSPRVGLLALFIPTLSFLINRRWMQGHTDVLPRHDATPFRPQLKLEIDGRNWTNVRGHGIVSDRSHGPTVRSSSTIPAHWLMAKWSAEEPGETSTPSDKYNDEHKSSQDRHFERAVAAVR